MNKNIEVEGGEIAIRNSHGDLAIIPKDKRNWVKQKLSEGCHDCIDSLVETLPIATDYAQDGSLYSEYLTPDLPTKKHPLDPNPDGSLPSYFKGSDANPIQLGEITVTAEAPDWLKYRKEYVKNNPFNIDEYVENRFNNPVGREKIEKINQEGWKKKLRQEGLEQRYNSAMDYVGEQLVKNKPQGNLSRVEWLNQMSDKEEEIIKRNPKYQSSLWADTKRGLASLVEQNPLQTFQNILNSKDFTNREKQEMLKDYADHPIMSKLGDAAKILNPLTVPSKMVQSAYKDGYTFSDALKGKKNNAGIVEDIATDPLNFLGVGLVGKLSKTDKVIDATKVGSKVLNKTDDVVKPIVSSVDDAWKQITKSAWKKEELPGLHLKSTMEGQAISKIVEPKTGLINIEQALGIIGKESGGSDKVALIKQGLGETIPKKMDYNEFRKVVQDQLIPLERQFATHRSNYGIDRLGYKNYHVSTGARNLPTEAPIPAHYQKMFDNIDNPNNYYKGYGDKIYIEDISNEGFNTIDEAKDWIKNTYEKNVLERSITPLENQTLILGNKSKFGRGSSAHGNPDETLGHVHFLRDAETPDVLTVTQIQSDAFQGTHRIMPKNTSNATALERQKKSLQRMEELQERNKSVLNKMKTEGVDEAGVPVQDYQIKQFEDIVKAQEQSNLFKKADIENFTQKQLLDKNHQERYLQELVDYAGKRGDINKIRVPTSETAAKVQGYNKIPTERPQNFEGYWDVNTSGNYSSEHQTILKKYSEQPKTIKKLFGVEPKIVTDSKGNTWYEFDIPDKAKKGKMEIKAFTTTGAAIGTGAALSNQSKNKTEQ